MTKSRLGQVTVFLIVISLALVFLALLLASHNSDQNIVSIAINLATEFFGAAVVTFILYWYGIESPSNNSVTDKAATPGEEANFLTHDTAVDTRTKADANTVVKKGELIHVLGILVHEKVLNAQQIQLFVRYDLIKTKDKNDILMQIKK